jgi:hypothetical protein
MREKTRWTTAVGAALALVLAACVWGESGAPGGAAGDDTGADAGSAAAGGGASTSGSAAVAGGSPSDSAAMLADLVMEWQGGADAWEATRYLRFDWIVERGGETVANRSHAWDRYRGDYRLSYRQGDGSRVYALFELPSLASGDAEPRGDVWVDGEALSGSARDSALRRAYEAFVNDSYWLLMPLKWRDPGVHMEYAGRRELPDGEGYPAVHLTFDDTLGVTTDQYWGFVDPGTGKMAAWQFHLEGREQKGPVIWWRDWQAFGPQELKLALDRRWEDGSMRIHFEEVAADTAVPDTVFTPPSE